MTDLDLAALLALTTLDRLGPARAHWLLSGGSPTEVIEHLEAGRLPVTPRAAPPGVTTTLVARWAHQLRNLDPTDRVAPYRRAGIEILTPGHGHWPFADDPEPPVLSFARGRTALAVEPGPRVAVVGTRRCTVIGRRVAHELGTALAAAGVIVVSGLASGIDAAAHRGALAADASAVIGVVATGLDVVYPSSSRELWAAVPARGLLLSEAGLGTRGERWRFPARNRLIAALADVVVVVESHSSGGSLSTVDEAALRGVPVMAVPGTVTSAASVGSNQLLRDGAPPVCSAGDVLDLLSLIGRRPDPGRAGRATAGTPPRSHGPATVTPDGSPGHGGGERTASGRSPDAGAVGTGPLPEMIGRAVLAGSVHVDDLIAATGRSPAEVLTAVGRLVQEGRVRLCGSTVEVADDEPAPGRP